MVEDGELRLRLGGPRKHPRAPVPGAAAAHARRSVRAVDLPLRGPVLVEAVGRSPHRTPDLGGDRPAHRPDARARTGTTTSPAPTSTPPRIRTCAALDPAERAALLALDRLVFFHLPRTCNHCLNPACAAACPSGAIYKRGEDGVVLIDRETLPRVADVRAGVPVQEDVPLLVGGASPRSASAATRGSRAASRRPASRRASAGSATRACCCTTPRRPLRAARAPEQRARRRAARRAPRPCRSRGDRRGAPERRPRRDARGGAALAGRPVRPAVGGGAAAPPRVPHAADGVLRPAALARAHRRPRPRTARRSPAPASSASRCGISPPCSRRATRRWSARALRRLVAVRTRRRAATVGDVSAAAAEEALREAGLTPEVADAIHRLTVYPTIRERVVRPPGGREAETEQLVNLQGAAGLRARVP